MPEVGWTVYVGVPYSQIDRKSLFYIERELDYSSIFTIDFVGTDSMGNAEFNKSSTRLSKDINELYNSNPSKNNLGSYELWEIDQVGLTSTKCCSEFIEPMKNSWLLRNRLHQSVVAKKIDELAFYQTQINPHFLYNTLECMQSIGQAYGIEEIQTIAQGMGKIFRYSVKSKDLVTVSEELDCKGIF